MHQVEEEWGSRTLEKGKDSACGCWEEGEVSLVAQRNRPNWCWMCCAVEISSCCIQGQAGCGYLQPGLVVGDPVCGREVDTRWSLWPFSTQAILWFSELLWKESRLKSQNNPIKLRSSSEILELISFMGKTREKFIKQKPNTWMIFLFTEATFHLLISNFYIRKWFIIFLVCQLEGKDFGKVLEISSPILNSL